MLHPANQGFLSGLATEVFFMISEIFWFPCECFFFLICYTLRHDLESLEVEWERPATSVTNSQVGVKRCLTSLYHWGQGFQVSRFDLPLGGVHFTLHCWNCKKNFIFSCHVWIDVDRFRLYFRLVFMCCWTFIWFLEKCCMCRGIYWELHVSPIYFYLWYSFYLVYILWYIL